MTTKVMMMEMPPRRTPCDLMGLVSIAFLPFWCLDAKGEKNSSRLSVGFAWVGHKHLLLSFLESLCPFIIYVLNFICYCYLCDDVDLGVQIGRAHV